MAYLLVVLVAAAVGAAAYLMTLRQGAAHAAAGRLRANQPVGVPVPGSGQTYLTVTDTRLDWESRLTGALGLVIAVIAGAAALAFTTYAGASLLVKLVHRAVG
jgi:hypothetical protein